MDDLWAHREYFLHLGFLNLTHWMTWVVVVVAGVLIRRWWILVPAGVVVAVLGELYPVREFAAAVREGLQPIGLVGSREVKLIDLVPGFIVGAVLTLAVQLVASALRAATRSARA